METFELLQKLSEKSKEEIQYGLLFLMMKGKLDFIDFSNSYIKYLQILHDDEQNKLIESNSCVFESLVYDKIKTSKSAQDSIQRRLYLLNQSNGFNMDKTNKRFKYIREEEANKL